MDMARPKEFDLERALHRAISAFSQKGFAATSTDELMRAMEVRRQSTLLPGGGSSTEAAGSGLPVSSVSFNSAAAMSSFACLAHRTTSGWHSEARISTLATTNTSQSR